MYLFKGAFSGQHDGGELKKAFIVSFLTHTNTLFKSVFVPPGKTLSNADIPATYTTQLPPSIWLKAKLAVSTILSRLTDTETKTRKRLRFCSDWRVELLHK